MTSCMTCAARVAFSPNAVLRRLSSQPIMDILFGEELGSDMKIDRRGARPSSPSAGLGMAAVAHRSPICGRALPTLESKATSNSRTA